MVALVVGVNSHAVDSGRIRSVRPDAKCLHFPEAHCHPAGFGA
jgi:hypothetical protein